MLSQERHSWSQHVNGGWEAEPLEIAWPASNLVMWLWVMHICILSCSPLDRDVSLPISQVQSIPAICQVLVQERLGAFQTARVVAEQQMVQDFLQEQGLDLEELLQQVGSGRRIRGKRCSSVPFVHGRLLCPIFSFFILFSFCCTSVAGAAIGDWGALQQREFFCFSLRTAPKDIPLGLLLTAKPAVTGKGRGFKGTVSWGNFRFSVSCRIFPHEILLHNLGYFLLLVHPLWRR